MLVSRSERSARRLIAGLALLAATAVAAPLATAQKVGPPIPLVPPPAAGPTLPLPTPAPQEQTAPTLSPPPDLAAPAQTITGEKLAPPAPGWEGDTSPTGEPMPSDFWRGTPRALAELLLAHTPDTTSPALQALLRRLLLSPAAAPEGPDAAGIGGGLPALRAVALLRLGEFDGARAVLAALPEKERAAAEPLAIEIEATANHVDAACGKVTESIRRDQSIFWQRSLIACQALGGETEKASLGLQLLGEQAPEAKSGRDDPLAVAVNALAGRAAPAVVERLDIPDALTLHALVAAKRRFAPALLARLRADMALTLALDDKAAPEIRIAAAERAAACGALPVAKLRDLYKELGGGATGQPGGDAAVERARRFVALSDGVAPGEREARIIVFAEGFPGKDEGGWLLAARLIAPMIKELAPDPGLAGSAAGLARLALATGDAEAAQRWLALDPGHGGELRPVLALAGGDETRTAGTGDAAAPLSPLLLALNLALGRTAMPAEWSRLPASAWSAQNLHAPPVAAWLDLAEAAREKRVGETVLAAILVAAPQGGLAKDPVALYGAIKGLAALGLAPDASRLAVEAALVR